jgi:hypothetical protein
LFDPSLLPGLKQDWFQPPRINDDFIFAAEPNLPGLRNLVIEDSFLYAVPFR